MLELVAAARWFTQPEAERVGSASSASLARVMTRTESGTAARTASALVSSVSGRLGQPGLADAGLAGHRHQGAPPGPHASQHRVDLGRRPDARHERVQHPDDHPSAILPVRQNVRLPQ
jgi:anaerobic selenocysteine-containing dehydrogenase